MDMSEQKCLTLSRAQKLSLLADFVEGLDPARIHPCLFGIERPPLGWTLPIEAIPGCAHRWQPLPEAVGSIGALAASIPEFQAVGFGLSHTGLPMWIKYAGEPELCGSPAVLFWFFELEYGETDVFDPHQDKAAVVARLRELALVPKAPPSPIRQYCKSPPIKSRYG